MNLEFILEWDKELPFESRDKNLQPEDQNGINLTVRLSGVDPQYGLKNEYKGSLSTKEAVDNYSAHLVWHLLGIRNSYVETENIETSPRNFTGYHQLTNYEIEEDGMKRTTIPFNNIIDQQNFKTSLEGLEQQWYIESREEMVNDCDYWQGFWGSSGLWKGSLYKEGNPSEQSRQFAYDLEQGLRNENDGGRWFSPGPLFVHPKFDGLNQAQRSVVEEINNLIMDNHDLQNGTEIVTKGLRELAIKYDNLETR